MSFGNIKKYEMSDSFQKFKSIVQQKGFFDKESGIVIFSWIYNATLMISGGTLALVFSHPVSLTFFSLISAFGMAGLGTLAHMASHNATSKSKKVNLILNYLGFGFACGVSPTYWHYTHNRKHHVYTNVLNIDKDINLMPWLALHEGQMIKKGAKALYYRFQFLIAPFLLCFNGIDIQRAGIFFLFTRLFNKNKFSKFSFLDIMMVALHYIFWIGFFSIFFPLQIVFIAYLLRSVFTGLLLFCVIAPTHFLHETMFLEKKQMKIDPVLRQASATINYKTGFLGNMLCNGIQHHIEHHCFPTISHAKLPSLAPEIKNFCEMNNIPYRKIGWAKAIWKTFYVFYSPKKVNILD